MANTCLGFNKIKNLNAAIPSNINLKNISKNILPDAFLVRVIKLFLKFK